MKKSLFFFLISVTLSVSAQTKLLTMEDAMVKNRSTLAPENLRQLQFIYGTGDYAYLKKTNEGDVWVRGNFKTKSDTTFLTLGALNAKLKALGYAELKSMPPIQFNKPMGWIMTVAGSKIALNPVSGKLTELMPKTIASKENAEESNAGYIAYLDNHNLYISGGQGDTRQLTTDGSPDIVYASSVHRDEFGISKGIFWSNSGRNLAFYRMDQGMVTDYPIIDWSSRPAKNTNIKYPMAGDKSHQVTVGVYNTATRNLVYLATGEPVEQYLTNIAWSPDERSVYVAVLNRGQDHMKLNQYDAATGRFIKTLFEEKDDKYVEPLVPMLFVKNKPGQFIWQSNRVGWNHLYLYDTSGRMISQLTQGNWEVTEVKGFDEKGDNLFYVSTEESPLTKNLYKRNLKTGQSIRVTPGFQVHNTQVNSTGTFVLDNYSSPEIPRNIQLIDVKTGKAKSIWSAANPLTDYALGKMSIFSIKNNSGDDLFCRLYKPVNFDSTKKYPVIVYWYGGPHAQMILNGWNGGAGDYWFQYMAERGFVVFTLDPRGSDNRGRAFEQAIFRRAGEPQMEDMMSGVNYLGSLPYVDKDHMGLFGWSYGGFMTTDFVLNHPGIFKAAVAGGPVMNWQYYEIMYGERYMDTPAENPEGYEKTNLIKKAGNLKDKLLLIHGIQDPVVLQQNSVDFVKACVDKGVQVDYMIYPGHEHNVIGKDRAHLYQKVTDYFMQYLK
ncbi:MAG: DPP IV N-terminal domain-containing protein [Chitinophagaceae bacterium]|nr:DPP IV N-terminal domain-containing protein [Chitinophagaceae bacterium]